MTIQQGSVLTSSVSAQAEELHPFKMHNNYVCNEIKFKPFFRNKLLIVY